MSVTVKITSQKSNTTKSFRFPIDFTIAEVIRECRDKFGEGGQDFGIFKPATKGSKARWLKPNHTLKYYDIQSGMELIFRKKHRLMKIRLADQSLKTILIDDSLNCVEIVNAVCEKLGIKNPEEYSLRVEGKPENQWLISGQGIYEQDVTENDILFLGKRLFWSDANVDTTDPVQLHLLYGQLRDFVLSGHYPTTYEEARDLAAIQLQIEEGNHNPAKHKPGTLDIAHYIPAPWHKEGRRMEKEIYAEHRKLASLTELNAKFRYVQKVRSLRTYGITFYECLEKDTSSSASAGGKKKEKWVPVLIGITRDRIMRLNPETKEIIKEYTLAQLKRWVSSLDSFTFDFGEFESEYYVVKTKEGEAISQLLSGYIDIILKIRKENARTVEDDGSLVAVEEDVIPQRGNVVLVPVAANVSLGSSSQTAGITQPTSAGQYAQPALVLGEADKINVNDPRSAFRQAKLLSDELNQPHGSEAFHRADKLTVDQWKDQIVAHSKGITSGLQSLAQIAGAPPEQFDKNKLAQIAKQLASDMMGLAYAARAAHNLGDSPSDVAIIDGAKKFAESMANLFEAAQKVNDNPVDPKSREDLEKARKEVEDALLYLNSAKQGLLADSGTEALVERATGALSYNVQGIVESALNSMKTLKDSNKMRDLVNMAKKAQGNNKALQVAAALLAPAVLNPAVKKSLLEVAQELANNCGNLVNAVRESGAQPAQLQAIGRAGKGVNDALSQIAAAIETAEPRGPSETDLDFAKPRTAVVTALADLKNAKGDRNKIIQAARKAGLAVNDLVRQAKLVAAGHIDPATKRRLQNYMQEAADAVTNLTNAIKDAVQNPENKQAQQRLVEAAQRLDNAVVQLVSEAQRTATQQGIRLLARMTAAAGIGMADALENAARVTPDGAVKDQLEKETGAVQYSIQELLTAVQQASKNPTDAASQNALIDIAQRVAVPFSQAVAQAKRLASQVNDPNVASLLNKAANELADAVQKMMQAAKLAKEGTGDDHLSEALSQIDAAKNELDTAAYAIEANLIQPEAGQTAEGAVQLLSQTCAKLLEARDKVIAAAKGQGHFGDAALDMAKALSLQVPAVKAVAGTFKDKGAQRNVLNAAKKVNSESAGLVISGRALLDNANDPNLLQTCEKSAAALNNAVASLEAAARGFESNEVDNALENIATDVNKLTPAAAPFDYSPEEYKQSGDALNSNAKALQAAVSSLVSGVKSDPKRLGGIAKLVASSYNALSDAALTTATTAPNKETHDKIIQAGREVGVKTGRTVALAKKMVSTKDNTQLSAELLKAANDVAQAISNLLTVANVNSLHQCDAAINQITNAANRLDLKKIQTGSPEQPLRSRPELLDELQRAAQGVANSGSRLVSTTTTGALPKLEGISQEAANFVEQMRKAVSQFVHPASASVAPVSPPARELIDAVDILLNDVKDQESLMSDAKEVAQAASRLIDNTKKFASNFQEKPKQQALVKAAQGVAGATSALARVTQSFNSSNPHSMQQLLDAAKELKKNAQELENLKNKFQSELRNDNSGGSANSQQQVDPAAANKLVNATRALALATADLIRSCVASAKDESKTGDKLSASSKALTEALRNLMNAVASVDPTKQAIAQATKSLVAAVADLESAGIKIAVGGLDSSIAAGKSYSQAQEELIQVTKQLASNVDSVVASVTKDEGDLVSAIGAIDKNVPLLVQASKVAALTTGDAQSQQNLLSLSKQSAESLLNLVKACGELSVANPQGEQKIVYKSKEASQAIGKLMGSLKAGTVLSKEVDSALNDVVAAEKTLNEQSAPSGRSYDNIKDQVLRVAVDIADKAATLNSADKDNIGQLSLQAKALADILPDLISLAKDAAATTKEQQAKKDIITATKEVIDASKKMVESAKAGDKNKLAEAFKQLSTAVPKLIASIKKGATAENMIQTALDSIRANVNKLNTQSIFAQAGQLETTGEKDASVLDDLMAATNNVVKACHDVTEASKTTTERLGQAAQSLAQSVNNMSESAIQAASQQSDSSSQEALLTAAKALALVTEQLVVTAKDFVRKIGKDKAAGSQAIASSLRSANDAANQLIGLAKGAYSGAALKERELDHAMLEISSVLGPNSPSQSGATPADVMQSCRMVTNGISDLLFATGPDDVIKAAKLCVEGVKRLIRTAKGAAVLAKDPKLAKRLVDTSVTVAKAVVDVLGAAKEDDNLAKVEEAALGVTGLIGDVVAAIQKLPGGAGLKLIDDEDIQAKAESELANALRAINEAANQLRKTKPNFNVRINIDPSLPPTKEEVTAAIFEATGEITKSTAELVKAAAVVQKERKANIVPGQNKYHNDPIWANGLISASKDVSESVQHLVGLAAQCVNGKIPEEALLASARQVTTATARIVTASRVRSDPNSPANKNLSSAARSVAQATNQLVNAAQQAGAFSEDVVVSANGPATLVGSKAQEYEQAVKILQLEKQLENARKNLFALRRKQYAQLPATQTPKSSSKQPSFTQSPKLAAPTPNKKVATSPPLRSSPKKGAVIAKK
jgi:talin